MEFGEYPGDIEAIRAHYNAKRKKREKEFEQAAYEDYFSAYMNIHNATKKAFDMCGRYKDDADTGFFVRNFESLNKNRRASVRSLNRVIEEIVRVKLRR